MIFVYIAGILICVLFTAAAFTEEEKTKVNSSGPASETPCSFHGLAEKLDKAESCHEFTTEILDLVNRIFSASHHRKITPCIVGAVRESIEACKRTKLPFGPATRLYDFRSGNDLKTVPTWIILHSTRADDQSKTSMRHLLLQTYLDELPPTPDVQNELYLACAEKGFNNYFDRIRRADLRLLPPRRRLARATNTRMEIRHGLKLPSPLSETFTVADTTEGFELNWFVPDLLQRFQSGIAIGIEFVAKGLIWGFHIRTQCSQFGSLRWKVVLCVMKPSQNNLRGNIVASLEVGRLRIGSHVPTRFELCSDCIETSDFPKAGDVPETQAFWLLPNSMMKKCYRCINKDGSCYLSLALVINPALHEP